MLPTYFEMVGNLTDRQPPSSSTPWLAEGDRYAAGLAIKEAMKTWPDHRLALLDDPELSQVF